MRIIGYTSAGKPKAACPWCGRQMLLQTVKRHIETKCPKWPQLRLFEEKTQ